MYWHLGVLLAVSFSIINAIWLKVYSGILFG
ncbi:cytochrome bd oxidase small subunit, CydX/CbdX family [Oceanospirillum sediminis]